MCLGDLEGQGDVVGEVRTAHGEVACGGHNVVADGEVIHRAVAEVQHQGPIVARLGVKHRLGGCEPGEGRVHQAQSGVVDGGGQRVQRRARDGNFEDVRHQFGPRHAQGRADRLAVDLILLPEALKDFVGGVLGLDGLRILLGGLDVVLVNRMAGHQEGLPGAHGGREAETGDGGGDIGQVDAEAAVHVIAYFADAGGDGVDVADETLSDTMRLGRGAPDDGQARPIELARQEAGGLRPNVQCAQKYAHDTVAFLQSETVM